MATGFSFADDPQMSVREKIERYFQQKNTAAINTVSVLDESTSDESLANSFSCLDQSFAQILNSNPHVTLIRNSKKGNATQMESTQTTDESLHQYRPQQKEKPPYMPTPTRRGEIRPTFRSDDSIGPYPFLWEVSDESFIEMEQLCESPRKASDESFVAMEKFREWPRKSSDNFSDNTVLADVDEPSFLMDNSLDDSVFEPSSVSMLSPMKLVALRRPSTILEESTIQSINSSEERSGASLSLKQNLNAPNESSGSDKTRAFRPSLVNVFPTRSREVGYYNNFDSPSSSSSSAKENSIHLMRFDSIEQPLSHPTTPATVNSSISLMRFDSSINEESFSNSSLDQTQYDSSDGEPPDQFNDTLEAVDYYMKQGQKIMDKTSASTVQQQQQVMPSPKSRNNSLLKQTLARRHLMSMNGDNNLNKLTNKKLF